MELKIPPPLLSLIFALFMWGVNKIPVFMPVHTDITNYASLIVFLSGLTINISAIVSFRKARTTVDPRKPESAARLVSNGIYRISRNPMYLGVLLILFSWGIWLGNYINIAVLIVFIWYLTKFQIIPEENALTELFQEEFEKYKNTVRRWI